MRLLTMLALLVLAGCAATARSPDAGEARPWDGQVAVYGALRAMLHEGQTGATVGLGSRLPDPDLHALGALADLSGEVTVIAGRAYLSYPEGADATRTVTALRTDAAATLLVACEVPAWRRVVSDRAIRFEDLDEEIARLAVAAGLDRRDRFPFLMEGTFDDLQWHVIDGRRLADGEASHQDHLAAAVRSGRERAAATLLGFYSESDQGVFTHRGSSTHIHCVLEDPLAAGHVDHVDVPPGVTFSFPAVGNERREEAAATARG